MAGCWLPRTTVPATGAMAKLVVEGVAGMNRVFGEMNALDYSGGFFAGQARAHRTWGRPVGAGLPREEALSGKDQNNQ